jgi:adenylate cyclase
VSVSADSLRSSPPTDADGMLMTFKDDLIDARDAIVTTNFTVRDGTVVPTTADVGYDDAVKLQATYLYADMVDNSGLVAISPQQTVGKVLRLYLDLNVRIIRKNGGKIRSFDGDRVMGIFVGVSRFDQTVKTAMQIKWACNNIIQPEIAKRYQSIANNDWTIRPACGIASGEAFIVRRTRSSWGWLGSSNGRRSSAPSARSPSTSKDKNPRASNAGR